MTMFKTALLAAAFAVALPAGASAQTFGGMPTVTPQKRGPAVVKKDEKKKPSYIVVDKGAREGFSSIQSAVDAVADGGVVVVLPGVYNENITLSRAVAIQGDRGPGAGVRIIPADTSRPCLSYKPTNPQDHAMISNVQFFPSGGMVGDNGLRAAAGQVNGALNASGAAPCIEARGGVFTLMESTVDGAGRHAGTLVNIMGGTALLEKNTITGGRRGVFVNQDHPLWDRALLIDNVVSDNAREGVHLTGVSSMLATGNLINDNGAGLIYNGHGDATVVGNKILGNASHGILLDREAQQVLLRLNQIWSNDGDGVKIMASTGLIEDNDIDGNAGYEINTLEHTGNVPQYYNDVAANKRSKRRKK